MISCQLCFQYLALILIIHNIAIIMCFLGHSYLQFGQRELVRNGKNWKEVLVYVNEGTTCLFLRKYFIMGDCLGKSFLPDILTTKHLHICHQFSN